MTRMSISVPQVMVQPPGRAGCGQGAVGDGVGGPPGGVGQVGGGEAGGRGQQPVGVGGVVAVEAEQGVEVDRAAGLVFGGLAVRDADRIDQAGLAVASGDPDRGDAAAAGELAEAAFDGLLGAPPQLTGLVVPHHVGGVVVAVRAQRLAEFGVVAAVPGEAGVVAAVRAPAASRRAWQGWGLAGQRDRSVQVCWRTGREWTGPKDGAVKVTNTAGWVATAGSTLLPPASPARMRW